MIDRANLIPVRAVRPSVRPLLLPISSHHRADRQSEQTRPADAEGVVSVGSGAEGKVNKTLLPKCNVSVCVRCLPPARAAPLGLPVVLLFLPTVPTLLVAIALLFVHGSQLQGSAKRLVRGCEKCLPALA